MSETTFESASSSSNNTDNDNNNENTNTNNNNNNDENSTFECNICLEQSSDPVITLCGHLFWYVLFHHFYFFNEIT